MPLEFRAIPALLMQRRGLIKTRGFQPGPYLGDPVNTARILNDKEADELLLLDIRATVDEVALQLDLIEAIASECFMPVGYGGGVRTLEQMRRIFALGVEKVMIGSAALDDPSLVTRAAERFGSQSLAIAIDYRTGSHPTVVSRSGTRRHAGLPPWEHAAAMEAAGAGEIMLTCVDREGMRQGYDLPTLRRVVDAVGLPVIAHGGADTMADLALAAEAGAAAAAAGSLFNLYGIHQAVLVTYPDVADRRQIFLTERP